MCSRTFVAHTKDTYKWKYTKHAHKTMNNTQINVNSAQCSCYTPIIALSGIYTYIYGFCTYQCHG